jgi:hypothetical protein
LAIAERCDPYVFYKKLRQILSGWSNNPAVPDGIVYEGVSDEPKKYNGGSAAQSSTIQAIDIALGIKHHPVRKPEESDAEYADHAGHDKCVSRAFFFICVSTNPLAAFFFF